MLTEQTKNFIEKIAIDMQKFVTRKDPNIYDIKEVLEFIKSMGCEIEFNAGRDCYCQGKIQLKYSDIPCSDDDITNLLKILFHEMWHFIAEKALAIEATDSGYSEISITPTEASANYFSRAMLLPEDVFVNNVIENVNELGMCNVFDVAEIFKVTYIDVIARGNDLSLWNKKGGM